ncbi:MAG: DUF1385 domain-containing protein [Polyangiaceae bacterium]|nr:DUF1385 domain-containing protein [Polyangiaceae bacterium]
MEAARASRPYIGGQAVLEGVMMRAPTSFAVVVRSADGSLLVRERSMQSEATGLARLPLLRGVASLVESLRLGREALNFSVEQLERDLEAQAAAAGPRGDRAPHRPPALMTMALAAAAQFVLALDADGPPGPAPAAKRSGASAFMMLALPIAVMVALPQGAAAALNRFLHLGLAVQAPAFQAMTGAFKLAIVIGLMVTMRRIPEIRRMFQYHGAEHKTISTYEAGQALTVENARAKTTLHPRCGTTFIVMVALVSILFFTALGASLPPIRTGSSLLDNVVFFLVKLPVLPPLVAVTFELQRLFARYFTRGPLRVLLWPGFAVQRITTAEPDDSQLEVALASLRATLFRQEAMRDGGIAEASHAAAGAKPVPEDVRFPSYQALLEAPSLRNASSAGC